MKKFYALLMMAVFALATAWAGEKTVVKYSFDDKDSPAVADASRLGLDYTHSSVVTSTPFLNLYNSANGARGATTISLGEKDLSTETWTLEFEWAGNAGCNSKTGHTILSAGETTLFDIVDASEWNSTMALNYGANSQDLTVPACNKSNRFSANVADLYNTKAYWHHFKIVGSADGVKMTVTLNGSAILTDAVLSETNVSPTALAINPGCGGGIGIDALLLTYYVEGEVINNPIASYTDVDGISREITATCDTDGANIQYSLDGGETWQDGERVIVEESCTILFKAVKGSYESEIVTFEAVAGEEIKLNTPTISRTSNTSVTISADQSNLLLSPNPTIYYTYGEKSGKFTGTKVLTIEEDATITAYAENYGFGTSETAELAVALFPENMKEVASATTKTSGWTANTFSDDTKTASERIYAALLLDDAQWGENVYLQTDGAWGLRASGNWYINSNTDNSWILVPSLKKGDIVVVAATYPASETVNATASKYSYQGRFAYEVDADGDAEIALKKVSASEMDYLYGVYAYTPLTEEEIAAIEAFNTAKSELQTAITEAKAIDTTDKNGAEDLATAITTAETALNATDATTESLTSAKADLAAAVKAFEDANKSDLMKEAETLAADEEAVAVGKLIDAIDAAKTSGDETELATAVEQFKADNADVEKDETAKVDTSGWKKFEGNDPAGVCATQFAPAITTYDGRTANLAENYETTVQTTGQIIYQNITGLENGQYKVGFYGNAFFTSGRGFDSTMEDGSNDVAYVFANDQKEFITARIATSTTENNFRQFDVEVTDGTIKLGMGKEQPGTNWHTMQIYQLTWFTTAKAVYAADKAEMNDAIAAAETLAADENKTNGKEELNTAIEDAKAAVADNHLNITELEAAIKTLNDAIATFKTANYVTVEGTFYIKNVAKDKYLAAGHSWGTQAIVNNVGLDITAAAAEGKVTFDSQVSNGEDSHFLGSNLYVDGDAYGWYLEKTGENTYAITNGTQYVSVNDNDDLVMVTTADNWEFIAAEEFIAAKMAALAEATEETPADATFLLKNPNFNRNDLRVSAWTVSEDCTNQNLNGGNNVNNCAESFHSVFTISQIVANAPKGTYKLTAQGFYRQDDEEVEDAPVFFINDATAAVPAKTGDEGNMSQASESFTNGNYTIEPIEFTYDGEGDLTIGISCTATHQWVIFDNFQLTFVPAPEKNQPGEYKNTPLTKDMFKGWDGFDDYAKVNNETPYYDAADLPGDFGEGATVYGSGNVMWSDYADITGATTMRITATPGMQFRVLLNRVADPENKGALVELQPVVGEEGYVDVDLSEYEYVHLNAIKTGWGSSPGTIESIILNPVDITKYTVESYVGSFYEALPIEIDLDGILAMIGATADTYKVVAEYPGGSRANDVLGTTDGWRDAEGNAKAWGDKPFFYLQDTGDANVFVMGGYPGNTGEVADYTGTLVFINTETDAEQKVTFTLSYIPVPPVTRNILDVTIVKTVEYASTDGTYTKKTAELTGEEINSITSALGLTSLGDEALEIYGYNPSEESLVTNWAAYDGWRAANGDFDYWTGDGLVPACVKIEDDGLAIADGKYNTYNIAGAAGTIKTYWAYANATDAVLVEIDVVYPDGYTISVAETTGGTAEANFVEATEGTTIYLTATPDEGYKLTGMTATYAKVTPSEVQGEPDTVEDIDIELSVDEDGDYSFAMPAGNVTVTPIFGELLAITDAEVENATVEVVEQAAPGETVVITVTPAEGKQVEKVTISFTDPNGGTHEIEADPGTTENTYTFVMPNAPVTITPTIVVHTGINSISADAMRNLDDALLNGRVFDMSGRSVRTITTGGFYIVEGKKVMIRK